MKYLSFISLAILVFFSVMPVSHVYTNTISQIFVSGDLKIDVQCNENYSTDVNYNLIDVNSRYNKIIVFVMEELLFEELNNDISTYKGEELFFFKYKSNYHTFTNYYTTNQDSVPSIISMLSSRFVPNEAYLYTSDYSLCDHPILNEYNLVDYFNDNNYHTSFFISHTFAPCEITKYNWNKINDIEGEYKTLDKNYICYAPYYYDTGCEDIVFLDDLVKTYNSNKNVFIMQELVFGHNSLYLKDGVSKKEYYGYLFEKFMQEIKTSPDFNKTLIIMVSDHGNKGYNSYSSKEGYKVPMLIYSSNLDSKIIDTFLSPLSFKDILFSYLYEIDYQKQEYNYIVGPTGSSAFGIIEDSNFLIINDRMNKYNIMSGSVSSKYASKLSCFLDYKKNFTLQ